MIDEEIDFTDSKMLRIKAEEELSKKQINSNVPNQEMDLKKLLHELQVHQIELEMQNEELRLAYESSETALKKYTMLYDFAPMGYFTLDTSGSISDLNFTGAEMLGERRFSLIGSNFKIFVSDGSKLVFSNFLTKLYATSSKESCKVTLGNEKTSLCNVYIEGIVMGDDRNCLLSVVDISGFNNK